MKIKHILFSLYHSLALRTVKIFCNLIERNRWISDYLTGLGLL